MQITINNETFKLVSYECSPSFVEIGDRTQTLDGMDHIEGRKIKRTIKAKTSDLLRSDTSRLLNVLKNAYLTVSYQDTITDMIETRLFILQNNPQVITKMWKNGREYYGGVELELQEKGAE